MHKRKMNKYFNIISLSFQNKRPICINQK
jgi:hypothetical protein